MTDFVIILVGGGSNDNNRFTGNPKAVVRLTDDSNSALGIPDSWTEEPQCAFRSRARTLIVVTNTPILIYLRNGNADNDPSAGVPTPIPVAAGGLSSYTVETNPGNDGLFVCRDT